MRLVCNELQAAWRVFNVTVALETKQTSSHLQKVFSVNDNALVFNFAVDMQAAERRVPVNVAKVGTGRVLGPTTVADPERPPGKAR